MSEADRMRMISNDTLEADCYQSITHVLIKPPVCYQKRRNILYNNLHSSGCGTVKQCLPLLPLGAAQPNLHLAKVKYAKRCRQCWPESVSNHSTAPTDIKNRHASMQDRRPNGQSSERCSASCICSCKSPLAVLQYITCSTLIIGMRRAIKLQNQPAMRNLQACRGLCSTMHTCQVRKISRMGICRTALCIHGVTALAEQACESRQIQHTMGAD